MVFEIPQSTRVFFFFTACLNKRFKQSNSYLKTQGNFAYSWRQPSKTALMFWGKYQDNGWQSEQTNYMIIIGKHRTLLCISVNVFYLASCEIFIIESFVFTAIHQLTAKTKNQELADSEVTYCLLIIWKVSSNCMRYFYES